MPRFTKKSIVTVLSVAYLAALTVLGAYAFREANYFSLPLEQTLPAVAVALPPLAGIAYESVMTFHRDLRAQGTLRTSIFFQAVNGVLLVYEVVVATLAGTHLSSANSPKCRLREHWQKMFSNKEAQGIRRIQDTFNCCGFNSAKDEAWPFKGGKNTDTTCMERFDRDNGCFEAWRGEERKVAIMLMLIPIGVFAWKALMILAPNMGAPWLPSAIRLTDDGSGNPNARARQAIAYRDVEEQATDDDSARAEVDQLNQDANFATHIQGSRVHASPLIENHDIDRWRGI